MKNLLLISLLLLSHTLRAQLDEDFSDGDFANNPKWTGSNSGMDFTIAEGKLRSNAAIANSAFYLSTENSFPVNVRWDFWVNLQFSTSGANYVDIYVISDKADLKSQLINGYFVRIGNTDDEISLYKRSGLASTNVKIIDGVNGSVGSTNNTMKIRLERDGNGKFTLEREITSGATSYFTEGVVTDISHLFTSHFGISIQQSTSSFFFKHFFDNLKITPILMDTIPPSMNKVLPLDSTTIEITFNEPLDTLTATLPSNYTISNYTGSVLNVLTSDDATKFYLKLTNTLNSGNYRISAVNLKDKNGNLIGLDNSFAFSYTTPYIAKNGEIIINEIFADPSPQIDLPSVEFAELYNTTNRTVHLKNWRFHDAVSSATFGEVVLEPYSYLILCAKSDTAEYKSLGKVIGLSPWPSLNNTGDVLKLISPENLIVDSVAYSDSWYRNSVKKQGGWSLERKDPISKCKGALNWSASTDTMGGTPGTQNSVYLTGYDSLILRADSLKVLSDSTLKVFFNKSLNSASLIPDNFRLSPAGSSAKTITADSEYSQVVLVFEQKFKHSTEYQLEIKSLEDCAGTQTITSSNLIFKRDTLGPVSTRIDTAQIIITELFADPSPEVGLPLFEFIEIFNPGKDTVDMAGWTINDATAVGTIHPTKLLPGQYAILCPTPDTSAYKAYGKTIGVQPWPSLNNNSDNITLRSFTGRLIDSVAYFDNWYRNNVKKAGGWTLEKIDLHSKCIDSFNWTASVDTLGGTPGKQNSVYISAYNLIPLRADSVSLISDTTLKIFFNKHIDSSTLKADHFALVPQNSVETIHADVEFQEVTLFFEQKLRPGTSYQLTIAGIRDCSGLELSGSQQLTFRTDPISPLDIMRDTAGIIITEIFADPSPEVDLPLSEFVEIFNPGVKPVDLTKWILSDATTKGIITSGIIGPGEYVILCSTSDTALFKKYGHTKGVTPWPNLTNTQDQITLKSFRHRLVDSVAYSSNWYKHPAKNKGGWTLEKIHLLDNSCNGFFNWTSSNDLSGGTPGRANSVRSNTTLAKSLDIDSLHYNSDTSLTIYLNMYVDTAQIDPANFFINEGVGRAVSAKFDSSYLEIDLTFSSKFREGTAYLLTANKLVHCADTIQNPNNQIAFSIPLIPEIDYPVVISEIMADPTPSVGMPETEYVEIHNPTDKTVDLKGMSYGDGILQYTFTSGQIGPGGYLLLCPLKDTLSLKAFGRVQGLPVWPVLNNEKDILILKNNKNREIHKISYNLSWYKDAQSKQGGYSLEIIDPGAICNGAANWSNSRAPDGGTPGGQNSVHHIFPQEPLKLIGAVMTDSISLLLSFNKAIDSLTAANPSNYVVNNGIGIPESAYLLTPNSDQVLLKLAQPPVEGRNFNIKSIGIRDCSGSEITAGNNTYDFIITKSIGIKDILISEILFNPKPGGVDFIEIYNNSSQTFDLKDLAVATIVKDSLANIKPVSSKQMLFSPGSFLALTSNPDLIASEYPMAKKDSILTAMLPAFNDNEGAVVLVTKNRVIDRFDYSEKMHFRLLKNFEGISLERSNFNLDANEPGNFRSATAASGFATPGFKNSQADSVVPGTDIFSLNSGTFSPDNDGFEDLLQVNYLMPTAGMIANVKIFNDHGVLVKNLLKNHTLNVKGVFTWDGLDESNNYAGIGIYIIYAEIFDTNGFAKRFRRSFALAAKL